MKLLFDQNLSPRLVESLADFYPGSAHVSEHGLGRGEDAEVWEHARANGYVIASKDSDFSEISLMRGFPPKVIWIRRGNCSTREVESVLRHNSGLIRDLEQSDNAGVLLLY